MKATKGKMRMGKYMGCFGMDFFCHGNLLHYNNERILSSNN